MRVNKYVFNKYFFYVSESVCRTLNSRPEEAREMHAKACHQAKYKLGKVKKYLFNMTESNNNLHAVWLRNNLRCEECTNVKQ